MEFRDLKVEERTERGSSEVRRLRKAGNVPGVVYAEGKEAQLISLDAHTFTNLGKKSSPNQLFKFKSETSSLDGLIVLVKALQIEPLKDALLHIDFLSVSEGHRLTVAIQVEVLGIAVAVKEGRAILNQNAYELEVECLPSKIPNSLTVDVSELEEGQSIHAAEISLPEGAVLKSNAGLSVVSVVAAKIEEEPVAEEVEGAEAPAEGEPVEGASEGDAGKESKPESSD